jgi:hypothetical protein
VRSTPRFKHVGASVRRWFLKLLARMVDGASDAKLERRFGSAVVQRGMFAGMARSFDPSVAAGFEGRIVYELTRPASGREPRSWTIEVWDGRARARRGASPDAKLTVRLQLADFMRVAAGALDPAVPLLQGRASLSGDFGLATRLAQMFGAGRPG